MENNNAGLKFRILSDGEIFVDNDKNTIVDYFRELRWDEGMLYKFDQRERFCRLEKKNYIDKDENYFIKYYIVLKDFSDVITPGEVREEYKIFQAGKSDAICETSGYRVFRNGKDDKSKGFVSIDVKNPLYKSSFKYIYRNVVCFISVIDNQGNERFTQTTVFLPPEVILCHKTETFAKFISRETVLCNAPELLHNDIMVLCVKIEFHKYSGVEIEEKILRFFEKAVPYNTEVDEITNDLFEECLHFDEDFFFDSEIGKILCNSSFFFKSRLNYSRFGTERRSVVIPYKEREHLINICRILMGDYFIVETTFEEICELYKVADAYGIPRVVEFCRRMLIQHASEHNIILIHAIAETYNDTELKTIVDIFKVECRKFICDLLLDYLGVVEKNDLEHLKNAHNYIHNYLECDNAIELKREYYSFNFNYEEIDCEFNFSSIFNKNENGELTLSLGSDFGKFLCKNYDSLMCQIEHSSSDAENNTIQIVIKDIERFKNIYRLFMKINVSIIYHINCLYKLSDTYGISLLMETSRNFSDRYICPRNVVPIRKFAEMCSDDFELKKIVETFKTECERYCSLQLEKRSKTRGYFGSKNFEIQNEEYDFYK